MGEGRRGRARGAGGEEHASRLLHGRPRVRRDRWILWRSIPVSPAAGSWNSSEMKFSGGVGSLTWSSASLAAWTARWSPSWLPEALGKENVTAVRMPYRTSSPDSLEHAQQVIDQLGIRSRTVDISAAVDGLVAAIGGDSSPSRKGNIMARMRMITLFDLSAELDALPLGTGNKTERLLGYFTWHADDSPPVNPIGDLFKTQVWALARFVKVPEVIVTKPASADLIKGRPTKAISESPIPGRPDPPRALDRTPSGRDRRPGTDPGGGGAGPQTPRVHSLEAAPADRGHAVADGDWGVLPAAGGLLGYCRLKIAD